MIYTVQMRYALTAAATDRHTNDNDMSLKKSADYTTYLAQSSCFTSTLPIANTTSNEGLYTHTSLTSYYILSVLVHAPV